MVIPLATRGLYTSDISEMELVLREKSGVVHGERMFMVSHSPPTPGYKEVCVLLAFPSHIVIVMIIFIVYKQRLILAVNTYYLFVMHLTLNGSWHGGCNR